MHRLIYVSQARLGLSSEELFKIIEQSARNNPSADLTGFLIYRAGQFLQLLEGPLMSLDHLLQTLASDPRHHDLRVLARDPIKERSFPRWRMKRIGENGDSLAELEDALLAEGRGNLLPPTVTAFLAQSLAA